jgi:hypothetical protein
MFGVVSFLRERVRKKKWGVIHVISEIQKPHEL